MIVVGTLFRPRLLPFLQAGTVLSGGRQVPAELFAHFTSNLLYGIAGLALLTGIVGVLTLNEPRRRYIAQLPRWQQWLIWPFHGIEAPGRSPSLLAN